MEISIIHTLEELGYTQKDPDYDDKFKLLKKLYSEAYHEGYSKGYTDFNNGEEYKL